jgi:hypothetical protein
MTSFSSIAPAPLLRAAGAAFTLLLLAGCDTAPLSFINDRQVYYRANLNRYPVFVTSVDGTSSVFHPLPITTGNHQVTFDATPVAGFTEPPQKTFAMTIEPCTRYYVAAQRTSPLLQDWELVVERTLPVAGCDPQREREKAQKEVAAGRQPPLSSVIESGAAPFTGLTPLASPNAQR